MKNIYLFILIIIAPLTAKGQIKAVAIDTIYVNYNKTVHLIFDSDIKYFNSVAEIISVDNPEEAKYILRLKSNEKNFSGISNASVATQDGKFYSWIVKYKENINKTYYMIDKGDYNPVDFIYINNTSYSHLLSPDKIVYIDFGDTTIDAQKAENTENIIKLIALEKNFTQTNVSFATNKKKFYTINVSYNDNPPAYMYNIGDSTPEDVVLTDTQVDGDYKKNIIGLLKNTKRDIYNIGVRKNKIEFAVNNIFVYQNIIGFKVSIKNNTNFNYDIDILKYSIVDKKKGKKTAVQMDELKPLFLEGYENTVTGKTTMEFYVFFNKFTIPDNKEFEMYMMERNGGRHIKLPVRNDEIINAKAL
jgi:conjugative transposon TraN protein